tara:strand:- start:110 stop:946 length:837 start_codon:yes stop_codon:yes gene_type:complete
MTGYGLSSSVEGGSEVSIEIKGVNHRFLEISIKSNDINNEIDQYIRSVVGKSVSRGKVDIKIKFKSPVKTKYSINNKLLKMLQDTAQDALDNKESLKFSDVKDIPGIFNIETDKKTNIRLLKREFNKALKDFTDSRKKEGTKIKKVIDKKLKGINVLVSKILKSSKKNLDRRLKIYKQKVINLIEDFDEERASQEIALLALKHDVSEELDRISFHVNSLKDETNKRNSSGKKIDFVLQELFRESNTLSVKLDDSNSKSSALDMKLLIEEMREQIQNVE